jgi:hypothetical protein
MVHPAPCNASCVFEACKLHLAMCNGVPSWCNRACMQGSLLPSLASLHSRSFLLNQRRLEALKRLERSIQVRTGHCSRCLVMHSQYPSLSLPCIPELQLYSAAFCSSSQEIIGCPSLWNPSRCCKHHPLERDPTPKRVIHL